jgi:2-aminoadipate transaminase
MATLEVKTPWQSRYAQRTQRVSSSIIRELLKFTQKPGMISFGGGLPAPEVFPFAEVDAASRRVIEKYGPVALQ